MGAWLNFNGKFKAEGTPVITADNRGFRYGDGLFETIKTIKGQIPLWDLHASRLFRSLDLLDFNLPLLLTKDELKKQILSTLAKNKITGLARVRLTVFRGDGGLFETTTKNGGYLIQAWPLEQHQVEYNVNGLVIGIYEDGKKSCDRLSSIKSNNYLLPVMAALHAKKNKFNDAIILNTHDRVCECSIANIFWIKHTIVYTTPLSEGCVAGVMRQYLINKIPVEEKMVDVQELKSADEIFLSNSIFGIRWVQRVQQTALGNKLSREIFFSTIQPEYC